MNKIKRLAGETALYGLGSMVPRFLNFLLLYLHTDVFAPAEYGVITKMLAFVAVINTLYVFGMETAYFRFATKPGTDERKIFNITQSVVIAVSLVLSIAFIILAKPIAKNLEIGQRYDMITLMVAIMFVDAVVAIPFARLRLQKKARQFATYKLINVAILIGLNIYFLKFAASAPDIAFIFIANLIANAFYLFFFVRQLLSWRPLYDRVLSPQIVAYAYPVMLTGLAGITNEMFSRIMLDEWLPHDFYSGITNAEALGIFGACYKFGVLMNLAIQAFRYAAEPFFFSNAAEKNSPQLFAKVNHYFIIACCILLLGVSINTDLLKVFLGSAAYERGLHIVPVLLLAYLFFGVYSNFSVWFKLTDKTYYGTFITIGGMLLTIAGNYILIPLAGFEGSVWAALLSYFAMAASCYLLGQRFYPVPYRLLRSAVYIAATVALAIVVNKITIVNQFLAFGFHTLIIIGYIFIIYMLERNNLRQAAV